MNCRGLIALALMLYGCLLAAEAPRAPIPLVGPSGEWDWDAQSNFFRERFGGSDDGAEPQWSQNQYDPRPADPETQAQELTLPMPCGGTMVFRRIEVGGNPGWLGEQQIELGSGDADSPVDGRRLAYISGTFTGDDSNPGAGRHYYLGKYEVTELQYRVLNEPCPQRLDGRRPAVKVSWYDAVDFTRRYMEWLYQNAPGQLPQEEGVRGYLRLPTEVEWEYAARGGLAVDYSEFQEPVFPTGQGSIDDYAWIRESVASSFEPHPVGALLPNPLGLYDILGNASELIYDLFRLSARGRVHAQPGGFLVKGAHFRTWRKAVGSAWRQEHPHFSPVIGMPNRLDTVGFRVAISAPVLTSEQRIKAVRQELTRLPSEPIGLTAVESCREVADEVRASLTAMQATLERCLETPERLPAPGPEPSADAD